MKEFKIGDMVRIKKDVEPYYGWGDSRVKEEVGEIVEVYQKNRFCKGGKHTILKPITVLTLGDFGICEFVIFEVIHCFPSIITSAGIEEKDVEIIKNDFPNIFNLLTQFEFIRTRKENFEFECTALLYENSKGETRIWCGEETTKENCKNIKYKLIKGNITLVNPRRRKVVVTVTEMEE